MNNGMIRHMLSVTLLLTGSVFSYGQEFEKNLATARTAYSAGNLEEARFAMEQMIRDLDFAIGRELLSLLPTQLGSAKYDPQRDNVTGNTGFAGVTIQRTYGTGDDATNIDIIGNSPMIGSINAILSLPFVGNSADGSQRVIKIAGYKGVLQKNVDSEMNKVDYTIQIPLNNSLLTLNAKTSDEAEAIAWANSIPVKEIAALIQ